jgi:hypothetical protein
MITGTFNGASIVALPACYTTLSSVEFSMNDSNSVVMSTFTGQTQIQSWAGADSWSGTVTFPPLTQAQADGWLAFLGELRGMQNCFLIGDPMKTSPSGTPSGVPVVDMSTAGTNYAMAQTLYTRGWTPNRYRLLLPDVNGKAAITVFPSLREAPTDGEALILNKPCGLFRLASNKRTWSADSTLLTHLSFQMIEVR